MLEKLHDRWSPFFALQVTRLIVTGRDSVQRITDKVINVLLCSHWATHVAQAQRWQIPVAVTL